MPDKVTVCIPTFRRPQSLKHLLDAVAALETCADISVLVADNDASGREGFNLCNRLALSYRWPLKAVIAHERGIAQVRNCLVAEALSGDAGFIAMIDDDEWPEPGWIDAFLSVQRETNADVLQGSIFFTAEGVATSDIRKPTGPVPMLQGAGNLFITRAILEALPRPHFDPAFALTGGEDREFFVRLAGLGARFAWADKARAHGEVPQSRQDMRWLLARAYSTGNSDMRVLMKHRPGPVMWLGESVKIAGAVLLSLPLAVILAFSPNHRLKPLALLCRNAGKLTAMMGRRYNEYAMVHGE